MGKRPKSEELAFRAAISFGIMMICFLFSVSMFIRGDCISMANGYTLLTTSALALLTTVIYFIRAHNASLIEDDEEAKEEVERKKRIEPFMSK